MNEYILIVEDEAVLYRRMKKILSKEAFKVSDYTPSVAEALEKIKAKRPDLVLLDIKLQGDLTGIDLGIMLYETYRIPFIYVTDYDNDMFFAKALETHHEHYLVKTKPRINANELKRVIYTALKRHQDKSNQETTKAPSKKQTKLGISALVDYLEAIKKYHNDDVTRKTVLFEDIAFFTSDIKHLMAVNNEFRKNYIWFITKDKNIYYLKKSLKDLCLDLPDNFLRVSDSYIVNLSPTTYKGRINNKKISVCDEVITIGQSYKEKFEQKIKALYYE